MTEFQSSEAILNDLFSSIESKYEKVGTNSESGSDNENGDSTKSSEEKVSQVSNVIMHPLKVPRLNSVDRFLALLVDLYNMIL